MRGLVAALVVLAWANPAGAEERYGLEDLQALEKQKSWRELVAHLQDVRPSKRDDAWQKVLEAGAVGVLSEPLKEDAPLALPDEAERLVVQFPTLKKSEAFRRKRAEVGIQGLQACHWQHSCRDSNEAWQERVFSFAQTDPQYIALGAAEMQMKILTPAVAVPLFSLALGDRVDAPECKRKDLGQAVVETLGWHVGASNVDLARQIASQQCWTALKPALVAALSSAKEKDYRRATCDFLTEKKALAEPALTECSKFEPWKGKGDLRVKAFVVNPAAANAP